MNFTKEGHVSPSHTCSSRGSYGTRTSHSDVAARLGHASTALDVDTRAPRGRLEGETWHGKGAHLFLAGLAVGEHQLAEALEFVRHNYRQVGYLIPDSLAPTDSGSLTAIATRHHKVIGTLSVWRDGPAGLQADEIYGHELDRLRRCGARLGEFGRLAMDSRTPPLTLLLSLVGKVAGASCAGWHTSDFVVECNPRHVGFYTRMLGFAVIGGKRECSQVGAPAVLLHVRANHLLHVTHQFGHVVRIKGLKADAPSPPPPPLADAVIGRAQNACLADSEMEQMPFAVPGLLLRALSEGAAGAA